MTDEEKRAEEERRRNERKRDAYFAALHEEEKGAKKRKKKTAPAAAPSKPSSTQGPKVAFPVGLKKATIAIAKPSGVSGSSASKSSGEEKEKATRSAAEATTAGATITGIPPPPAGDPPPQPPPSTHARYVKFTVPPGAGGDCGMTHVRVQVPLGRLARGPVMEVELPEGAKEGDEIEAMVPVWDADDQVPPPPPRGTSGVPTGVLGMGMPGVPPPPPGPGPAVPGMMQPPPPAGDPASAIRTARARTRDGGGAAG